MTPMPYVRTDDRVRVYYEEHGAGTPLVLAYGIGGNVKMWDVNVPGLARRHRQNPQITTGGVGLMSLAELVDGPRHGRRPLRPVGAGWPTSSKRGAALLFSAKSALDPGGTSVNQFCEAH